MLVVIALLVASPVEVGRTAAKPGMSSNVSEAQ
jgi:hypothetical protein